MRDRFDIDQAIKITGLGIHAEQADGGADFDVACQIAVKKLWKIKEYESLEEQNRLIKLPCAVGDTVYAYCSVFGILAYVVDCIVIDKNITFQCSSFSEPIGDCSSECLDEIDPDISDFGKTVFLTREEAEATLEELERGKGE